VLLVQENYHYDNGPEILLKKWYHQKLMGKKLLMRKLLVEDMGGHG
jgi:hypothetical protein